MTHNILLTRFLGFKGENQCLLTRDGNLKDPYRRSHGQAEEQHEILGFDASRPLPDVIPERANSLAVVEGVLSRFF